MFCVIDGTGNSGSEGCVCLNESGDGIGLVLTREGLVGWPWGEDYEL